MGKYVKYIKYMKRRSENAKGGAEYPATELHARPCPLGTAAVNAYTSPPRPEFSAAGRAGERIPDLFALACPRRGMSNMGTRANWEFATVSWWSRQISA